MTDSAVLPTIERTATIPKLHRWLSVDVLRGLTIGFMIMVNNNGGGDQAFWAMKHADWNGFTPTDLVFPTFLFLVGISTVFSTQARLAKGDSKSSLLVHTIRRALILFLLGLLVNSFPYFHLHTLRVYGVLPRIALCYLLIAVLYLYTPAWKDKAILAATALIGYWILMRFVPVPGYGVPTHAVPLLDRDANLVAWLDRQIFSAPHLYEHTRDPEGLLSTLPALATALIGMLTGIWLRSTRSIAQKARGIAYAGCAGLLLGGLWNFSFPVNKKLWTSSYVLYAAGWSLILLALSIYLIDIYAARRTSPRDASRTDEQARKSYMVLLVFGTNAIAAYVLSELLPGLLDLIHPHPSILRSLYRGLLHVIPYAPMASMVYCIVFAAVCWLPIYVLYRRRIFLKI
ncbi:MAG TPA: heparan-alpha-glucosaminide N-acetyltransferase domain-containing protein [Acidobacteriaceae bacterium]|nr:heparan-alpha-glucosaminide N-acetyltransferase domain-containing protein [Acidobacteriaceae bacterium]